MTATPLATLADDALRQAVALVGRDSIDDDALEAEMLALVGDAMLARRVIDWLPEIFGLVLISHLGKVTLPKTFNAKDRRGAWIEFALKTEPLFEPTLRLAMEIYHSGPRDTFRNVSLRSGMVGAVNEALNAGHSLDGGTLSGPALIGIPAETYLPAPTSWWQRVFG